MQYLIIICGDWNDGDYVYNQTVVNSKKELQIILDGITMLKTLQQMYHKMDPGNWGRKFTDVIDLLDDAYSPSEDFKNEYKWLFDTYTKEQMDDMYQIYEDYIPHGYECQIHTIVSVEVYEFSKYTRIC